MCTRHASVSMCTTQQTRKTPAVACGRQAEHASCLPAARYNCKRQEGKRNLSAPPDEEGEEKVSREGGCAAAVASEQEHTSCLPAACYSCKLQEGCGMQQEGKCHLSAPPDEEGEEKVRREGDSAPGMPARACRACQLPSGVNACLLHATAASCRSASAT